MENTPAEDRLDLLPSVQLLWRYKFLLLALALFGGGLAYVIALFITPLYESHAILLPSNTSSRDKQLEEFTYGYEVHSERLLQLLASEIVLDSVEKEFDLGKHYGVDIQQKMGWDQFQRIATQRIQFHKTRYNSVVISVQDEDPELAAAVANRVGELVNTVNAGILKRNARVALEAVERDYQDRLGRIGEINDSIRVMQETTVSGAEGILTEGIRSREARIRSLRNELDQFRQNYQIYDFGEQINVLNEQLAEARAHHLQEKGAYEILKEAEGLPDTAAVMTHARMVGAGKRVEYFEQKLTQLSAINKRYLSLTDDLEEEQSLLAGNRASLNSLRESYEPSIVSRNLQSLQAEYDWDLLQVRELRRKYQRALANFLDPVPIAYIASYARPSYSKIYPNTIFTMIVSALGALVLGALGLTFRERFQTS